MSEETIQEMECEEVTRKRKPCKGHPMKGAKVCYPHSFGKIRNVPWHKNATFHCMLGILGLLGTGATYWSGATRANQEAIMENLAQVPARTAREFGLGRIEREGIALTLRYAYEFDQYLGATNEYGNEDRIIDPGQPIRKRFDPDKGVGFVFGVANGNPGIPFEDVWLQVVLVDEGLEVVSADGWQTQRVNKRYSHYFSRINNTPLNVSGALVVKFPHSGTFLLQCSIEGRGVEPIRIPVKVLLYQ
ncbi:MAG: hypothetical protein HY599_00500 [Candidatus Omnitrophica bacterium]|nr:hypothetical protein [Candidatus Omnitrophota bacterium]